MSMDEVSIEHRLTAVEKLASSNCHRIKDLEQSTDALNSMATSMAVMAEKQQTISTNVETIGGNVTDIGKRVGALEAKPAKRWDGLVDKVLYIAVGAFIAWVVAGFPGL